MYKIKKIGKWIIVGIGLGFASDIVTSLYFRFKGVTQ
jgi:hypothetical protein